MKEISHEDPMSPTEEKDYETRKQRAIQSLESAAEDMTIIRTQKLYRKQYKTWEDFLQSELKITRQWAFKMEKSAVAVEDVKKNLSTMVDKKLVSPNTAKKTLEAVEGMSVKAGAELSKIQPGKPRVDAAIAASASGTPTVASIKEAAKAKASTPPEPEVVRDGTGYPVPQKRLALWMRGEEVERMLSPLRGLRGAIRRFEENEKSGNGDLLFKGVNLQTVLTNLDQAFLTLRTAIPYAVCTDCQGHRAETCITCKGRGLISEYFWKTALPEEARKIRLLSVKK